MKTPVFFLVLIIFLTGSITLACRCRSHTAAANAYLRNCVTAINSLVLSSAQPVSDISNCQDERLGVSGAYADGSVVSSNVTFLENGETFTVTVKAVNDAVVFFDGENISLVTKPKVTFSQRVSCWWERLNPLGCHCSCDF